MPPGASGWQRRSHGSGPRRDLILGAFALALVYALVAARLHDWELGLTLAGAAVVALAVTLVRGRRARRPLA